MQRRFRGPAAVGDHLASSHTRVQQVGTVTEQAGADRLELSHVGDPTGAALDVARWTAWAQQGFRGRASVGADLERITLH